MDDSECKRQILREKHESALLALEEVEKIYDEHGRVALEAKIEIELLRQRIALLSEKLGEIKPAFSFGTQ